MGQWIQWRACSLALFKRPGVEAPQLRETAFLRWRKLTRGGGGMVTPDARLGIFQSRFLAPGHWEPGYSPVRGHRIQSWAFGELL